MKLLKLLSAFVLGVLTTLIFLFAMYASAFGYDEEAGILVSHAAFSRDFQESQPGLWEECERLKKSRGEESQPKTLDEALGPYCPFDDPVFIGGPYESLDVGLAAALNKDTHYEFIPKKRCPSKEACAYIRYDIVFIIPNVAIVKMWAPKSFSYEHLVIRFGDSAYSIGARGFII